MDYLEGENLEVFDSHKAKVIENITKSKSMGMNKITAILAIDDEDEIIQGALISWLIKEGYRVSLRKEDYNILVIEWWEYDVLFKALIFRINSDYFFEKWSLSKVLKKEYEIWWFI